MFAVGDAVVHPAHGAGVITGLATLQRQGRVLRYYEIELLGKANTNLMVPVENAERIGLRAAISSSELNRVWQVLRAEPVDLPNDYKKRHKIVTDQLQSCNILDVAAAVRDMAWRQQQDDGLTKKGQEIYAKGIEMLAGEIAASRGISLGAAEVQVQERLVQALQRVAKTGEKAPLGV